MVILFIVCVILLFALFRKVNIVTEFSEGVRDGLKTVLNILPSLLLIFTAIGVLRSSGLLDLIIYIVRPLAQLIGIPEQTVPLAILRPFSGSGSFAIFEDLINQYGTGSRIAIVGAILCASTETTFYTLGVYLSSFSEKCWRVILCSLIADLAVVFTAGLIV